MIKVKSVCQKGLTKKKELFTTTPSTDTCRGGKNQLFDLFSQPHIFFIVGYGLLY